MYGLLWSQKLGLYKPLLYHFQAGCTTKRELPHLLIWKTETKISLAAFLAWIQGERLAQSWRLRTDNCWLGFVPVTVAAMGTLLYFELRCS